jgi:hypothetical protein
MGPGIGDASHTFSATGHVNAPLAMLPPPTATGILEASGGTLYFQPDYKSMETLKFRPDLVAPGAGKIPLGTLALWVGGGLVGLYTLYKLFVSKGGQSTTLPVKQNGRRRNPERVPVVTRTERLKRAVASYESFHWGDSPTKIVSRKVSKAPRAGMKLGKLVSVAYETHKNGEKAVWEHEFGEEGGKRPDLVADVDTDRLHIVGGDYKIRPEGIID